MCLRPGYTRCCVRLIWGDVCPLDQAVLRPLPGCSCWNRLMLSPQALFTSLRPGAYLLTLRRQHRCMHLLLRLPPGGSVTLRCRFRDRQCRWRRDPFHSVFNRP